MSRTCYWYGVCVRAFVVGGEAGWDTLDDHDSRGRPRPSDALTDAGGTVPSQYEVTISFFTSPFYGQTLVMSSMCSLFQDDFDTLSVRSEVSEFSLQHRKQLEAQLVALQEEVERSEQVREREMFLRGARGVGK